MLSTRKITLASLLESMRAAALAGARTARGHQLAGLNPRQKSDDGDDLLTEGDEAAQASILRMLPESREEGAIGILAEEKLPPEKKREDARWRWVIDPIDGTLPYSRGESSWCVSIALQERAENWESRIGVVYQASPEDTAETLHGNLFSAVRGEGAYCAARRLRPPETSLPIAEFSAEGDFGTLARTEFAARGITTEFRRSICHAACDMLLGKKCAVVQGPGPMEWDVAAATLIAREAGAYVHTVAAGEIDGCPRHAVVMAWDEALFRRLHMRMG